MLKKTIVYTDYNDVERTEDFFFNLTKTEIADWELSVDGGLSETIKKIVLSPEPSKLIGLFKGLIHKSYGRKSDDGKRFEKSDEILNDFIQCPAYDVLYMELVGNAQEAVAFIRGILPADMRDQLPSDREGIQKLAKENGINIG